MGRIQSALDRAEAKRRRTNLEKSGLAPVITVEHLDGDARGFRRSFRQQAIMLGRGDHNDVPFDPFVDATVSAQHAQIRVEGDEVLLYDMGSLNGCFVAGQRVRRARIEDGVEFRLGRSGPRLRVGIGALTEGPACRQAHTQRQDRQDRHHHQQLDQGEPRPRVPAGPVIPPASW